MQWDKKGLIFTPCNNYDWMVSHAQLPVPYLVDSQTLRIYFGTRDQKNRTVTTYIEVDANNFQKVKYVHDQPVIGLGQTGDFDHAGAMPSSIVKQGRELHLYYIGWSLQVDVPYQLSIGLAISRDEGKTFEKFPGSPVVTRSRYNPVFVTSPCVFVENKIWKMWYISCTKWEAIQGKQEPFYTVKYAESQDGKSWQCFSESCLAYDDFAEAYARPYVFYEDGLYHMFYSYRRGSDFRENAERSYRLGYARSHDGRQWTRHDKSVGIGRSSEGWDSQMIEYGSLLKHKGNVYLIYNGNGFGASGLGYASLKSSGFTLDP